MTALVLLAGVGFRVPMEQAIQAGVGLMFMVIGNVLGKVTRNFFVGIRTPWALASDEVWLRTHWLGARLFVLAGVGLFVSGLSRGGWIPIVAAVVLVAAVPIIYSCVVYRRLQRTHNDWPDDETLHRPT